MPFGKISRNFRRNDRVSPSGEPIFSEWKPESKEPVEQARTEVMVFVVDDNVSLRYFLAAALLASRTCHQVRTFAGGAAAIEALRLQAPDVVLSDLDMPGVSGEQVALAAAALPHPPRIVLMSGDPGRLERAGRLAAHTLQKPFAIRDLMALIQAAPGSGGR